MDMARRYCLFASVRMAHVLYSEPCTSAILSSLSEIQPSMRNLYPTILLALALICPALSEAQTIKKVKVKAFVDESGHAHSPYAISAVTTADNGAVVGLYPTIDGQPDWIEEKKGYTTKAAVHTWDRAKITHQVKKEPYLVYGRDKVDPISLMRFDGKSYLLGYQNRSTGGSAIIYSQLEGSGITPSACNELFSGDMQITLKERQGNELIRKAANGIRAIPSESGDQVLLAMIGKVQQGAKHGPLSLLLLNKELSPVWNESLFLGDADKDAVVLDVLYQGEASIYILVGKDTKGKDGGKTREVRLYQRGSGVKNHQVLDLEDHYIQDARLHIDDNGNVQVIGIYGKNGARNDRTFGAFSMTVSSEDLSTLGISKEGFDDPEDNTFLAGVDHTSDGRGFITTASYIYDGVKSGTGGTELKNVVYHCSSLRIFHIESDGSIVKTTTIPMANAGSSALEVVPVTTVFNDELMLFYNDDPANAEKRKKGNELDPEKAKSDVGAQYTQLSFSGAQYSRPFLKEDSEVRSIFPMRSWEVDKGELFLMGVVNSKNPRFYPIKILITAAS